MQYHRCRGILRSWGILRYPEKSRGVDGPRDVGDVWSALAALGVSPRVTLLVPQCTARMHRWCRDRVEERMTEDDRGWPRTEDCTTVVLWSRTSPDKETSSVWPSKLGIFCAKEELNKHWKSLNKCAFLSLQIGMVFRAPYTGRTTSIEIEIIPTHCQFINLCIYM